MDGSCKQGAGGGCGAALSEGNVKSVVIDWVDSCEKHGWTKKGAVASNTKITSRGILVRKTKKAVTISTSYSKEFNQYCSPLTIPRSAIKKMKVRRK